MIVIIDDEYEFALILKKELEKSYKDTDIYIFMSFDEEFLNNNNVEIIFLDIELEDQNGIELANEYRQRGNEHVEIVFVSSHENYWHRTYAVFPVTFIRKARLKSDVIDAVALLNERRRKREMPFILNKKIFKLMDVLFIESKSHDVFYHFKNGSKIKRRIKISQVEEELKKFNFVRCHQSFIVNILYIEEYYPYSSIVLKNGKEIPATRTYNEQILDGFRKKYSRN